jgi:hypothetical protein
LINNQESTFAVGVVGVMKVIIVYTMVLFGLRRSERVRSRRRGVDEEMSAA